MLPLKTRARVSVTRSVMLFKPKKNVSVQQPRVVRVQKVQDDFFVRKAWRRNKTFNWLSQISASLQKLWANFEFEFGKPNKKFKVISDMGI